jgi:ketosteroid isomerase-like protein
MTAHDLFIEAFRRLDAGDLDGFMEMQTPDCHWITPIGELHGRDEVRAYLAPFQAGFPTERRHDLERVAEVDGSVYAEVVFRGVNDGALETPEGTLPATGKPPAQRSAHVVDVDLAAGQATAVRVYYDQLDFLGQLGLLPQPVEG